MREREEDDGQENENFLNGGGVSTRLRDVHALEIEKQTKSVTVRNRLKAMFSPVQVIQVDATANDAETHLLIRPEAFRMLFYVGFCVYLLLAIVISSTFGVDYGFNTKDNAILDTFGMNNICIYFDDPPFTYFSAALWIPLLLCMLSFFATDSFRMYDCYRDDGFLSKGFMIFYACCTVYEVVAFVCMIQIFATSPEENLYVHTIPYLLLIFAFWTITFKRYLFFRKVDSFKNLSHSRVYNILGSIYVIVLVLSAVGKILWIAPNLFGARLWEHADWKWAVTPALINEKLFSVLVVVVPLIAYYFVGHSLRVITVVINRNKQDSTAHK